MANAVVLQHIADFDRFPRRVATVAVNQKRHIIAQSRTHRRHHGFGSARPLILVMTAFHPDTELEGIISMRLTQTHEAGGLILGRDVAPHAGCIHAKRTRRAAEKLADTLSFQLSPHIPERRVQTAQRPAEIGAGELVLQLRDSRDQALDVRGILPQRMRRHLAVQHHRRDIGVVG